MEQYPVRKIEKPIDWCVTVPGSKSMTNRALLMAALSDGTVTLDGVLFSDDSRHFISSLTALGFDVLVEEEKRRVTVKGEGGTIPKKEAEIDVGSAGTAARFLTAMLGMSDGSYVIQASGQMKKRPMKDLFVLLEHTGAEIIYLEQEGFLPVKINGQRKDQKLTVRLDISRSTQFLSAMLLISPMLPQGLHIQITSEKTDGSYIRITRNMMENWGVQTQFDGKNYEVMPGAAYHKTTYVVEPDMSAACYFYALAAATGKRAMVKRMRKDSLQGDMKFIGMLEKMGCEVSWDKEGGNNLWLKGPDGKLKGIEVKMSDFSDQALTLAAIAPFADSKVTITGIAHIRGQESDRIKVIVDELTKMGISCNELTDGVEIYPGTPKNVEIETYNDHRVAMSFAVTGLAGDGMTILNPECCKKTFAGFFDEIDRLEE